jgi:hypothetical protein
MRPAYNLTGLHDARRFLSAESPNTPFVPSGYAAHDAGDITNVHNLTDPYRSAHSPRPSGDEALAALMLLAGLRDWLADVEPDLIAAARDAGVTWEALAPVLRVGDRRAAQRRHARLLQAAVVEGQALDAGAGQDVSPTSPRGSSGLSWRSPPTMPMRSPSGCWTRGSSTSPPSTAPGSRATSFMRSCGSSPPNAPSGTTPRPCGRGP